MRLCKLSEANNRCQHVQARWESSPGLGTIKEGQLQEPQPAIHLREELRKVLLSLQADMEAVQQSASEAKQVSITATHTWIHVAI